MSRQLRKALGATLVLLVGATEGPRLWPLVRQLVARIDWQQVAAWPAQAGRAIGAFVTNGAAIFGWTPLVFGASVSVALVAVLVGTVVLCWPSSRGKAPRRGSGEWTRRQEAARLARNGAVVAEIARRTSLAQDAVRTVIAAH